MVIDSIFVYYFVDPKLTVKIISRNEETAENEDIDFDIRDTGNFGGGVSRCPRDWKGICRKQLSLLKLYQWFWI